LSNLIGSYNPHGYPKIQQLSEKEYPKRVETLEGFIFICDTSAQESEVLFREEIPLIPFPPQGRFLDMGANMGFYSIRAANYCEFVLAVDNNSWGAMNTLRENIKLNNLSNIQILEANINESNIDSIIKDYGPFDAAKMDIEGGEGCLTTSKLFSTIPYWQVEIHSPRQENICNCDTCKAFKRENYYISYPPLHSYGYGNSTHYLFARKP
jgi:hypothetical protein